MRMVLVDQLKLIETWIRFFSHVLTKTDQQFQFIKLLVIWLIVYTIVTSKQCYLTLSIAKTGEAMDFKKKFKN